MMPVKAALAGKNLALPVRKIGKSYQSLTGKLNLPGIPRAIAFESSLERDFFVLQWFDPLTTNILEQPVEVPYEATDKKKSVYIPDALVSYRDKPSLLAEVKISVVLAKQKRQLKPKFDAARKFAAERGWDFRVFTEKEIRITRFQLAWHMLGLAKEPCKSSDLEAVVVLLCDLGRRAKFGDLLQAAEKKGIVRQEALRLIQQAMAHRLLAYEETFPVTMETTLLVKGRGGIRLVENGA